MKKFFAVILALAMTFALSATALATPTAPPTTDTEGTITIQNPVNGKEYNAYKIFDLTYTPNPQVEGQTTKYSYTIQKKIGEADNPWFATVKAYADDITHGLILTPVAGDDNTFTVTYTADTTTVVPGSDPEAHYGKFSAADFAEALKTGYEAMTTKPEPDAQRKAANPQLGPLMLTTDGNAPVANPSEETPDNTKVPLGYYFVTSDLGTVCSLDSSSPNIIIYEKNTNGGTPGFDDTNGKTFGDSATGTTSNDGSAQIGDTLYYKIDAHVPQYLGSYPVKTYVFTDTLPKGLTLITTDGTIKATLYPGYTAPTTGENPTPGSFTGTAKTLTIVNANTTPAPTNPQATYKITNNSDGTTTLEITVYPENIEGYYPDAYILLEYQATVDKDATFINKNTVTLTWTLGDSGVTEPEPTPTPGPNPPETEAEVKVYGFILNKTDSAENNPTTLEGALFKLCIKTTPEGDGNPTYEDVPLVLDTASPHDPATPTGTNETKYYRVWTEGATGTKVDYSGDPLDPEGEKTFIQAGKVAIFGLEQFPANSNKQYVLKEVKAPDGYNPVAGDIPVSIVDVTTVGGAENNTTPDGWSDAVIRVKNSEGSELPSTGGIGTTIFYVVGSLLMVGAAVLLIVRKKMSVME